MTKAESDQIRKLCHTSILHNWLLEFQWLVTPPQMKVLEHKLPLITQMKTSTALLPVGFNILQLWTTQEVKAIMPAVFILRQAFGPSTHFSFPFISPSFSPLPQTPHLGHLNNHVTLG